MIKYEACFQELCAVIKKHSADLSATEVLAIGANMVGKMIAMQDRRTVTPEMAMQIVIENIELGNRQVIDALTAEGNG